LYRGRGFRQMQKRRKAKLGRVVSNKMQKTVVVEVERFRHHPLYRKMVRTTVRYKAHDERNECKPGDVVRLLETRPLSRHKRWRVAEIVQRAEVVEVRPEELEPALEPPPRAAAPPEAEEAPAAEDTDTPETG